MVNILYHNRFDLTTEQFDQVKHLLPKAKNTGRPPLDNYRTLNASFWILRTGAPWRDLPLYYGNWNSIIATSKIVDSQEISTKSTINKF